MCLRSRRLTEAPVPRVEGLTREQQIALMADAKERLEGHARKWLAWSYYRDSLFRQTRDERVEEDQPRRIAARADHRRRA